MDRREFVKKLGAGTAVSVIGSGREEGPRKLLFDTDIGGDIDDALALIYLLNSPEINLRGVTTVHGDTSRKARYARDLITAMGRGEEIACRAGSARPLTKAGRPATDGGGESGRTDNPPSSEAGAVDFLVRAIREPDGPRHIVAVGMQTNVAMALIKDPGLADRLDGITLMGYNFQTGLDPYNVGSDIDAARHLLASRIPLRVLPVEIGVACQMKEAEYKRCLESECPQMKFISDSMRRWVEHVRRRPGAPIPNYLPRPYDSLTAMTLTHPDLFQWQQGTIELTPHDDPAKPNTQFHEQAGGIHRIVVGVDRGKAMALHEERLLACRGRK